MAAVAVGRRGCRCVRPPNATGPSEWAEGQGRDKRGLDMELEQGALEAVAIGSSGDGDDPGAMANAGHGVSDDPGGRPAGRAQVSDEG